MQRYEGFVKSLSGHQLDLDSIRRLSEIFTYVEEKKGTALMRAGKLEDSAYLIHAGVVRAHLQANEKDKTFWFGNSGDLFFSYNSVFLSKPGYESISTVTECGLFKTNQQSLMDLCQQHLPLSKWLVRYIGRDLIKTEQRMIDGHLLSAEERYNKLLVDMPTLIHHVPLNFIASFLGINQVTLSRIRSSTR